MSKKIYPIVIGALTLILSGAANADERLWKDHQFPFTFLFGNHIDTHQETRLTKDGDLAGFFYIYWTDDYTVDGRVAKHCTMSKHYEEGCFAGWKIKATPCIKEVNGCEAMFLYHYHDHPVWMIGPQEDSSGGLRGTRSMIAQPGSYTHMHWLTDGADHEDMTMPSSLVDVEVLFGVDIEVPEECNVAMAKDLTPGTICPGYYLEIKAVENFVFQHGGEKIPVRIGIDNRTHLNIVSSYRSLPHDVLPYNYVEDGDHTDGGD